MIRYLPILLSLLLFWSLNSDGSDQMGFTYSGQPDESLSLETVAYETRYRERVIEDTCYRSEPYQERICRRVTRYRRVCRRGVDRRVCRTEPGRRVCRIRKGRKVCSVTPGRRVCRMEPGRRICRDEPYYERVCRYETRYRQVPYTCRKTITESYQVQVDHYADINVIFEGNSRENHEFSVTLGNNLNVDIEQVNNTNVLAVLVDTDRRVTRGNRSSQVDITFRIKFMRKGKFLFRNFNFENGTLSKRDKAIYLDYSKWDNQAFDVSLVLHRNNKAYFSSVFTSGDDAIQVNRKDQLVVIDLKTLGLSKKIKRRDHELFLTLTRNIAGDILTPNFRNDGKSFRLPLIVQ